MKKYGPGREQGYLYQKLSYLFSAIVEDRAVRSDYQDQLIKKRDGGADLGEFVLDAIRATLATRRAYIVDQKGEPLAQDDIPPDYGLASFGYFQHTTMGGATTDTPEYVWDHAHTPLGHYMKRSRTIAFSMNELYTSALVPYAREQKRELPRIDDIKKKLIASGLLAENQQWIKGRNSRYVVIELEKLDLPGYQVADEEEEAEKRELLAETDNVVDIGQARADRGRAATPAQVIQGEQTIPETPRIAPAYAVEILTTEDDPFNFDPYA